MSRAAAVALLLGVAAWVSNGGVFTGADSAATVLADAGWQSGSLDDAGWQ